MEHFLGFVGIGLLAGAAARVLYPGRQPMHVLGTLVLGMLGAQAGGWLSLTIWPAAEDAFYSGNLLMAVGGALLLIVFGALVSYGRSVSGVRKTSS